MENQLDRSLKSCLGSDGTLSVSFLALSKEPFPLLEGRLSALCQQLGESVGMLSNHTVEQHQVNQSRLKCLRCLHRYPSALMGLGGNTAGGHSARDGHHSNDRLKLSCLPLATASKTRANFQAHMNQLLPRLAIA